MAGANYRWGNEALCTLKALNAGGMPWRDIAAKISRDFPEMAGLTATACEKRCNRLLREAQETSPNSKWSEAALEQVRALYREGKSAGEIVKALNRKLDGGRVLNRNMVIGLIHRRGWNKDGPGAPPNRTLTSSKPPRAAKTARIERQKPATHSKRGRAMGGGLGDYKGPLTRRQCRHPLPVWAGGKHGSEPPFQSARAGGRGRSDGSLRLRVSGQRLL